MFEDFVKKKKKKSSRSDQKWVKNEHLLHENVKMDAERKETTFKKTDWAKRDRERDDIPQCNLRQLYANQTVRCLI